MDSATKVLSLLQRERRYSGPLLDSQQNINEKRLDSFTKLWTVEPVEAHNELEEFSTYSHIVHKLHSDLSNESSLFRKALKPTNPNRVLSLNGKWKQSQKERDKLHRALMEMKVIANKHRTESMHHQRLNEQQKEEIQALRFRLNQFELELMENSNSPLSSNAVNDRESVEEKEECLNDDDDDDVITEQEVPRTINRYQQRMNEMNLKLKECELERDALRVELKEKEKATRQESHDDVTSGTKQRGKKRFSFLLCGSQEFVVMDESLSHNVEVLKSQNEELRKQYEMQTEELRTLQHRLRMVEMLEPQ